MTPLPRWFALAAVVVAAAAAASLVGRPVGLGLSLVGAALCASAALLAGHRSRWAVAWWAGAAALCALATLRDAVWVTLPALLAALALAAVAAGGAATWGGILRSAAIWLVPAPLRVVASLGVRAWERLVPALRGALLAALLLAVFGALLAAADAAFSAALGDVLEAVVPQDRLAERLLVFAVVLAVAGGLARSAEPAGPPRVARPRLGRAEWLPALAGLDLLFATFVAVRLRTLFGGHEHVLETAGLTYAEYARQGFGTLVFTATLTLAVVAGARRWARPERPGDERLLRGLLALLCALTLVVLASALERLGLYMDAFGATRLRLAAQAELLWLAAVFAALLALGALRRTHRLPHVSVSLTAAAVLAFGLSDPDRRIAERNVDRYERTGDLDGRYLSELSADAAPALRRLPDPVAACAKPRAGEEGGLPGFNLARERARSVLRELGPCG